MHPILTPAKQASTLFTFPGVKEDWFDQCGKLYTKMIYLSTIWAITRLGIEQICWRQQRVSQFIKWPDDK